jgi:hypothetical protein
MTHPQCYFIDMTEIDLLVKFTLIYKRAAVLRPIVQRRLNFIWLISLDYVKIVVHIPEMNHRMPSLAEHAKNHGKPY